MSTPVWCAELASAFWAKAGPPPRFPRDLQDAVLALPFNVIDMAGVSVDAVRQWFGRTGIPVPLDEPDRPLMACLVAWRGEGFAFIDSLDDHTEQAFSLAHELAHFLRDYLRPRERIAERLGRDALEVLDGMRPPTPAERLHAVLRHVSLGSFVHLLRRDDSGRPLTHSEREAEAAADRLAFELLAPAGVLGEGTDRGALADRLVREFGLPPGPAATYAAILSPEGPPIDRGVARLLRR